MNKLTLEEFVNKCFPAETYPQKGVVINGNELHELFEHLNTLTLMIENPQAWKLFQLRQDLSYLKQRIMLDSNANSL